MIVQSEFQNVQMVAIRHRFSNQQIIFKYVKINQTLLYVLIVGNADFIQINYFLNFYLFNWIEFHFSPLNIKLSRKRFHWLHCDDHGVTFICMKKPGSVIAGDRRAYQMRSIDKIQIFRHALWLKPWRSAIPWRCWAKTNLYKIWICIAWL